MELGDVELVTLRVRKDAGQKLKAVGRSEVQSVLYVFVCNFQANLFGFFLKDDVLFKVFPDLYAYLILFLVGQCVALALGHFHELKDFGQFVDLFLIIGVLERLSEYLAHFLALVVGEDFSTLEIVACYESQQTKADDADQQASSFSNGL